MNQEPTTSDVLEAIDEVKDTSPGPGADKVRIRYIRETTAEIKLNVTQLVQEMFTTRATRLEKSVKIGQIVALFKKRDRNECGNYREGVSAFYAEYWQESSGNVSAIGPKNSKYWTRIRTGSDQTYRQLTPRK